MPQGPLLSFLVAHMLLPSLDNQLVDIFPCEGESELSEHYFLCYRITESLLLIFN